MSTTSNVHPIRQRTPRFDGRAENLRLIDENRPVTPIRRTDHVIPRNPTMPAAETLETSLDEYRSTMLDLAHRAKAFEMQMVIEHNTAQIKLEAAGYKALLTGVPEDAIYALGEDMAEALESAMNTVAGA